MTYVMILVHACELHSSSEIGRYHLGGVKVTNFLASTSQRRPLVKEKHHDHHNWLVAKVGL